ncbi:MAG: hypothetical protein IKC75_00295 [Clostridia bacterium]|nr:hypothetical protein [Clostridia bacterium]
MKRKRILIFSIVLVLIVATLLTTALLIYSPLRYRAKLYDYCNDWIEPTFYMTDLADEPFIITDEGVFHAVFIDSPFKVNFDKEMVVVYMDITSAPSSRGYYLKKIEIEGDTATVYFKSDKMPWDKRKGSVRPWERCMVVKMKKLDVSTVVFTEM